VLILLSHIHKLRVPAKTSYVEGIVGSVPGPLQRVSIGS
jgi:hypothetical protein